MRGFLIFGVLVLASSPLHSENLNRKHGGSWNCSYLSVGLPFYKKCLECESAKQDFDDTGKCIPKYSLRDYGRRPADVAKEAEEQDIADTARDKEYRERRRHERLRKWLDSDVSGW